MASAAGRAHAAAPAHIVRLEEAPAHVADIPQRPGSFWPHKQRLRMSWSMYADGTNPLAVRTEHHSATADGLFEAGLWHENLFEQRYDSPE